MAVDPWNSLEVAKLILSALTPIVIALVGIWIHRTTKKYEQRIWHSQKLVERRIATFDDMAPLFNDLLCYFTYVGCWKDLKPPEVVALKRTLDKKIHLAAPLFAAEFLAACSEFQNLCFQTYGGWGTDARLRTAAGRRQEAAGEGWSAAWEPCFAKEASDPQEIKRSYKRVMQMFSQQIGIYEEGTIPELGRLPRNIR